MHVNSFGTSCPSCNKPLLQDSAHTPCKTQHTHHARLSTHTMSIRPTQWIMYVPSQVNRSQKCILLIVQYKYIKSFSGDFHSPESDPPHKIMRYWVYYSTQLCFWFPPDRICQVEMICIVGVPVLKRHFGGAGPQIFYMIHRGGRLERWGAGVETHFQEISWNLRPVVNGT